MRSDKKVYFFFKRILDITLSLVGLTVLLPISIIIIIEIMLEDGPPLFFCDKRVGKNGKIFRTIKFRSMVKDAEKFTGSIYAVRNDPRVTPIGKILRVTAMDELPQLINIFKGDMSFVGPRPEKDNYVENFQNTLPEYHMRHSIMPGLTGPAQIYLRYDSPPKDKLKYDLLYVDKANLLWDMALIAKSFAISFKAGWEKFEGKRVENS